MKKLFNTRVSETALGLGLLLIRLGFGSALMLKGFDKLQNFNAILAKGFLDPFGLGPKASLALVIFAEFFCSILVGIGLLTRLAAIPIVITMCVALFKAHHGHFYGDGQAAGLMLVSFLTLLITGPGKFSVDKALGK